MRIVRLGRTRGRLSIGDRIIVGVFGLRGRLRYLLVLESVVGGSGDGDSERSS